MNSNDILDMIGDANGTYVWDTQEVRSGTIPAVTKRKMPIKKILLIAAAIALTNYLRWRIVFRKNKYWSICKNTQTESLRVFHHSFHQSMMVDK